MAVYKFKPGFTCSVSAETAATELERIRKANGTDGVRPAEVVDAARPKDSPLHTAFNWDNKEAAELYRQEQARTLIRSIVVVKKGTINEEPKRVKAFVSVTTDEGRRYVSTARVATDEELHARVVDEALTLFRAFRRRYEHLLNLPTLLDDIDQQLTSQLGDSLPVPG